MIMKKILLLAAAFLVICSASIMAQSGNAMTHFNLGNEHMINLEYQQAIEEYTKTIELRPDFHRAFFMRGNAKNFMGDHEAAIEDYDATISLAPDFASAYFQRGIVHFNSDNFDQAIADWEKVLEFDPSHVPARQNLEIARRRLQPDASSEGLILASESGNVILNLTQHFASGPAEHNLGPTFGYGPMDVTFIHDAETGQTIVTFTPLHQGPPIVIAAEPESEPEPEPESEPESEPAPEPEQQQLSAAQPRVEVIIHNITGRFPPPWQQDQLPAVPEIETQEQDEPIVITVPPPSEDPPVVSVNVIPGLPDPDSGKTYHLQVGAWSNIYSASLVVQQLQGAGFDAVQEQIQNLYRVYAKDVPASTVPFAIRRLGEMGFRDIWIREQ